MIHWSACFLGEPVPALVFGSAGGHRMHGGSGGPQGFSRPGHGGMKAPRQWRAMGEPSAAWFLQADMDVS